MAEEFRVPPGRVRVGDAERDHVTDRLHENYALGRLTAAELDQRLNAALAARTLGELQRLTADLPEATGKTGAAAKRFARLERAAQKDADRRAKDVRRQRRSRDLIGNPVVWVLGLVGLVVVANVGMRLVGTVVNLAIVVALIGLVVWWLRRR